MGGLRKLQRADGTELKIRCRALNRVQGFIDPGVHADDYEPVLQLLADCKAITGRCEPYIVVIEVRRDGQLEQPCYFEAGNYEEIIGALASFHVVCLVPDATLEKRARLVRHFGETKERFLRDIKAEFDLDLENDERDHGASE